MSVEGTVKQDMGIIIAVVIPDRSLIPAIPLLPA